MGYFGGVCSRNIAGTKGGTLERMNPYRKVHALHTEVK